MREEPGAKTANVGLGSSHRRNFPRARARCSSTSRESPESQGRCGAGDRRRRGDPSGGWTRSPAEWRWLEQVSDRRAQLSPRRGSQGGDTEGLSWSHRARPWHQAGKGPGIQASAGRGGANKVGAQRHSVRGSPRPCAPASGVPVLTRRPQRAGLGPRSRWPAHAWCSPSGSREGSSGWCSRRLPQLGRRRLARPGAAREARSRPRAGAGGGRRAGAAAAAGRAQPKPPVSSPGARGRHSSSPDAPGPASPSRAGGASGTPGSRAPPPRPGTAPCARGRGGEAPPPPLRAPLLPAGGPPLGSALTRSSPAAPLRLLVLGSPAPSHTHARGHVVQDALGILGRPRQPRNPYSC